jgi:lysophospholipase L1-like esterase
MHQLRALIFVCAGIGMAAACNRAETPTNPTPAHTPANQVNYAVVGASDAVGFGGTQPCLPFDPECPSGTGYAYVIKRRFQSEGATVQLSNRGVPGAVLSPAMLTLARDIGRNDIPGNFLEQIVPFVPASATHISIFAGGNDANVIAQNVRAGRGGADIRGFIDQQVRQFGTDLTELVSRLRARAPNARIAAMNLPNLGAAPYVSSLSTQDRSMLQRIATGITDRINALSSQGVTVVDLMCESRLYSAANFSSDGFHPNDAGYALMAELLYPALRNGTAPTPSANCAQRTLLPVF